MLASDLPLQGDSRAATAPMVEAIRFVLDRHGFKAGRFSVGYQSCDDSTAQAGTYDRSTCFRTQRRTPATSMSIGVIGPYNSGCSDVQIPVAEPGPGRALGDDQPSNTWNGLTRPYEGMRRGELDARYPSGERNYVRIAAADHLQSVANATLVKELGPERPLRPVTRRRSLLHSPTVRTGSAQVSGSGSSAPPTGTPKRIGVRAPWTTDRAGLTRRPSSSPAFLHPHGGAFIRDLRAQLGRRRGADGARLTSRPSPTCCPAPGPPRQGMYVSDFGVRTASFRREEGAGSRSSRPRCGGSRRSPSTALYAAQATEILLDAIARSDGTRSSVTRELRRTNVEDGILGDIRFDRIGDLVEAPSPSSASSGTGRSSIGS